MLLELNPFLTHFRLDIPTVPSLLCSSAFGQCLGILNCYLVLFWNPVNGIFRHIPLTRSGQRDSPVTVSKLKMVLFGVYLFLLLHLYGLIFVRRVWQPIILPPFRGAVVLSCRRFSRAAVIFHFFITVYTSFLVLSLITNHVDHMK